LGAEAPGRLLGPGFAGSCPTHCRRGRWGKTGDLKGCLQPRRGLGKRKGQDVAHWGDVFSGSDVFIRQERRDINVGTSVLEEKRVAKAPCLGVGVRKFRGPEECLLYREWGQNR